MPWSEITPMDQRRRFISDVQQARDDMTTLCARYGISRKTGYKWLSRYTSEGPPGLLPRSHRTHTMPLSTAPEVVSALLELRQHHPTWGAKKLLAVLARREPRMAEALPARSTAAALLKRHGLITSPRRRRALSHPGRPLTPMEEPNAIWTADFKGQFKTGDGHYCFPLTVADGASRYLLACRGLTSVRTEEARPVFQELFHTFGLPTRIRSDNGVPFATIALGRLSPLSVWWIRVGVLPELIEPAHPEQNGRHERMHRTLKAETTRPPAANRRAQQRLFDHFQEEYNTERPHEGLALRTPAACYSSSPRAYPARLPALEYPAHCEIRLVSRNGGIRWHNHWVNVSHVLGGEYIAFEEIDDGLWTVSFGPLVLGRFDERRLCIEDTRGTTSRNPRKVSPISQD